MRITVLNFIYPLIFSRGLSAIAKAVGNANLLFYQLQSTTMPDYSDLALYLAAFFGLAGVLMSFISSLSDLDEFVSDISTGLHREISRAVSSNNLLASSDNSDAKALHPTEFRKFKVQEVVNVSYNTRMIRFQIPPGQTLGLSMGRHVSVRGDIGGKPVLRPYTPTSRPDTKGHFDLVVKVVPYTLFCLRLSSLIHPTFPSTPV